MTFTPSYPLASHLIHSCGGNAEAQELIDAINGGGGGSGTVTTISVVTANGFSGSVANPTTTPAITISLSTNAITYAKIQQASASTLLGNPTGSLGNVQEITLGTGLSFSGSVLNSTGGSGSITGPATSVVGDIVTWNNTTGTLVKDSGFLISEVFV
jgi:hypothetical protein